jgi:hypothetical protein
VRSILGRPAVALLLVALCALAAAPAAQAEDPLSDADGDGIPYKWETAAPPSTGAPTTTTPDRGSSPRCKPKQRLRKGKCVPKCKKGKKPKRASA